MGFEIKGLDDFQRNLKNLQKNMQKLHGKREVSFDTLFAPAFMRKYTKFSSIDELFEKSGFKVDSNEDLEKIPDAPWDEYIAANTRFRNWKEMLDTAGKAYGEKQMAKALKDAGF